MSLQQQVMEEMKMAMKAKRYCGLRITTRYKVGLLLAQTDKGAGAEMSEADEIKLVQKLVKQRKTVLPFLQNKAEKILQDQNWHRWL